MKTVLATVLIFLAIGCSSTVSNQRSTVSVNVDCCRYTGVLDFAEMFVVIDNDTVLSAGKFDSLCAEFVKNHDTNNRIIEMSFPANTGSSVRIGKKFQSENEWNFYDFIVESDTAISL